MLASACEELNNVLMKITNIFCLMKTESDILVVLYDLYLLSASRFKTDTQFRGQ